MLLLLAKQEIRTLEGKLVKQFSEQLAVKARLGSQAPQLCYFPNLEQWLQVAPSPVPAPVAPTPVSAPPAPSPASAPSPVPAPAPVLLQVVGVSPDTSEAIRARVRSLEELKDKTECELRRVLLMAGHLPASLRQEDLRRLCRYS